MLHTPLYDAHQRAGAKIVEFAGFAMPVQYAEGLAKEHLWTRASAGLFDVSHMGQIWVYGPNAADFLGKLTPSNISLLKEGRARYTVLTNESGGIIDDLIITNAGRDHFFVVVNASRVEVDLAWMRSHCPGDVTVSSWEDRALLALQGPEAESALQALVTTNLADMPYMSMAQTKLKSDGEDIVVSRLGYTGEDGFEISLPAAKAEAFWDALLQDARIKPAGLGARDTLRLEMGYPLYGHDLDETTSPIEANLAWVVSPTHGGYFGEGRINREKAEGPARLRVGVQLTERGIARENSPIMRSGQQIGLLSSGGMSPTLHAPIGQGYVPWSDSASGTEVEVLVRGTPIKAKVTPLGFVDAKTKSQKKTV